LLERVSITLFIAWLHAVPPRGAPACPARTYRREWQESFLAGVCRGKGEVIGIRELSAGKTHLAKRRETLENYDIPTWLALHPTKLEGQVLSAPSDSQPAI
jgi:hypothetical protein